MIGQNESHYRDYQLPGGYEVRKIHIYAKDRFIYNSRYGYFQDFDKNGAPIDVIALDLPEPVRANKVNLRRSDCFFVPYSAIGIKAAELYIPAQLAPVKIHPEQSMERAAESHSVGHYFPVDIQLDAVVRTYTGEKDARGDYVLQEKRISVIHERTAPRWELTEEGMKAKVLHDQMKTLRIDIDFGAVIELLKYYDVKLKP